MVLAWENLRRFLWCWSSFCCCCYSSFVDVLHSHFLFDIIPHPSVDYRQVFRPILYFQPSPSHSDSRHFHFSTIPLVIFLPRALRSWVGIFYPQAFFTLCSFTNILTCVYQGFPGSRQFFLEVCRASYWSSKHRPGPSVCLIHSNPQSFIHLKFVLIHVNIARVFTCGENFDKKYRSAAKLISNHENIKQQPN